MCAFSTPWGRECFTRMPFGLDSASEVLQERNNRTFGDIPNVHVIEDDLHDCAGKTEEEHDSRYLVVWTQFVAMFFVVVSTMYI